MSAGTPTVTPATVWTFSRWRDALPAAHGERPWLRLATFAALAAYGVQRWATLLRPAPTWRLAGLLVLAVVIAGAVPLMAQRSRPLAAATAFLLALTAFPISGLRWHWFTHVRIAVSATRIGNGLEALPNALVPYLGTSHAIRLVIVLGAAVLLLDAAAVMAFGRVGSDIGDGRRAAAALPLLALAVVPSTLLRPEFPYLQGLLLFALLAAFMWAERVRRGALGSAIGIVALAGVAGAIAAPRIDQGSPWVDYRAWAGTLASRHIDTFNWSQTYGPLRWPQAGHQVLTVQATRSDYWKAEDLDTFNGYGWAAGAIPAPAPLDADLSSVARWSQTISVTIEGMRTDNVIAAGYATPPVSLPGGIVPGQGAGTWLAGRTLGPGTTYTVRVYSPHPSAAELGHDRGRYPRSGLADFRAMALPQADEPPAVYPQLTFPPFHSWAAIRSGPGLERGTPLESLSSSVYGPVYAIARRLSARAANPYVYAVAIEHFLALGYAYNQNPPASSYPIVSFLLRHKVGYCQQFAGAMALLLRMGGVPARVATGFTPGSYSSAGHQWVVSDIDAHAWVEAWFPRYGWVRFDPTPTSAPARGGVVGPPILKGTLPLGKTNRALLRREIGSAGAPGSIAHHGGGGGLSPWVIAAALVPLAALAWPLVRIVRASAGTADLLAELEQALQRTRRPLQDGVTLAGLERRLGASPEAAAYVRALRMARYGGAGRPPTQAQRRALRHELSRGLGFSGRVRAAWALPPWLPTHRNRAPRAGRS